MSAPRRTGPDGNPGVWHQHALQRLSASSGSSNAQPVRPPAALGWTPWPGIGPGPELLGDLDGARVAELGCGTGRAIAAIAAGAGPAACVGVDAAPAQIQRARTAYNHLRRLTFVLADATTWLRDSSERLDVCLSIYGAVGLAPPVALLAAAAQRLRGGGRLVFSVHPGTTEQLTTIRTTFTLPDRRVLPVALHTCTAQGWTRLLHDAGFRVEAIHHPATPADRPDGRRCLIITARTT